MANDEQGADGGIRADLMLILGGRLSPDSVGAQAYAELVDRVRENAVPYVEAFDRLLADPRMPDAVLTELNSAAFLHLVRDVAPDRVRASAARWAKQLDRAPAIGARRSHLDAAPAGDDEEAARRQTRLEQRRRALQRLAEGEP